MWNKKYLIPYLYFNHFSWNFNTLKWIFFCGKCWNAFLQHISVTKKQEVSKYISAPVCKMISFFTDHQYALTCYKHCIYYWLKPIIEYDFKSTKKVIHKEMIKKTIRSKFEDTNNIPDCYCVVFWSKKDLQKNVRGCCILVDGVYIHVKKTNVWQLIKLLQLFEEKF